MTPRIGLVLGDPAGIGPELIARLLASHERPPARVIVVGDLWLLREGEASAGVTLDLQVVHALDEADVDADTPIFLEHASIGAGERVRGEASAAGGRSVLGCLRRTLDLARAGDIDALTFAPLNKHAMHLAGYGYDDELHWFADELDYHGHCGELNVLENLWTSRVTSHVALREAPALIDAEGIVAAVRLADDSLKAAGIERPRIAVAALNPHAGDGGIFGREEIDVIAPAVARARALGIDAEGPFPADTVFVRARDGRHDAVVTMYHDQGQIAMKLMGFERGVTVLGGLPIAITTPAHGTAYDIAGKGIANDTAMHRAFAIACRMAG